MLLAPAPGQCLETLTASERAWLRAHPVIRMATEANWPPIDVPDALGEPSGIAGDYLRLVEGRLGIRVARSRNLTWEQAYALLARRESDLTTSMAATPERLKHLTFTRPYMEIPIVLATGLEVAYLGGLGALEGKAVALVSGFAVGEWVAKDYPKVRIVPVKNAREGLEALRRGEVAAYADNLLVIGYYISKLGLADVKISGETGYVNKQCMAVRKDWPELAGILQKALDSITAAEREEIFHKWVPVRFEHKFGYRRFSQALAGAGLLLAVSLFWTWRLAREAKVRKAAERALRDSEEKYRRLVEGTNDIVYSASAEGVITYISPQVSRYGLRPEDLIGQSIQAAIAEEDRARIQAEYTTTIMEGKEIVSEFRLLTKAGQVAWFADHGKVQRDENGKITGTAGVIVDITVRKAAQEAAIHSQNLQKETERIGKVGGWSFNIDTLKQVWTEEVYRIHEVDIKPDPSVAEGINYYAPESRPIIERAVQRAIEHGEGFDLELEIITAKNNRRWVHTIGRTDLANRRIYGFFQDVTERKAAEKQLLESEARFRQIADIAFGVVYEYRLYPDGRSCFPYASAGMNDIYEVTPEEVREDASIVFGRIHPDDRKRVSDAIYESARTLTNYHCELRMVLPRQGLRWRVSDARPERLPDGSTLWYGTITDITERKRSELEKLKLQQELAQSQKMESVGRLAGGVAHDFNNLLTAIGGYAGFLMRGMGKDDPKLEDVKEIIVATERAASLTKQLLAFSRKQILNPQVLDLNASVAGVSKLLKRLIGEEIQLQTKFAVQACLAKVDPGQIDQVLVNLAVNARDAMPKGGTLTLETAIVNPDALFSLRHPGLPPGPLVCLTVRDTGCGLTAEAREHLFEPFFTTKEHGKGTGLGLSTVFGIIIQSGGEIEVESEPDSGTVFRIYLPHMSTSVSIKDEDKDKAEAKDKAKDKDKDALLCGSETILLVEDEDILRRLAERLLKTNGYTVIAAADGKSALEAAQRYGKPFDLLMTDVVMPGMNGRELAKEMAARKLSGRTLFMSGYTDDAISAHGVLEPGIAFIYKPFTVEALSNKLREVLDGPADKAKP